MRRKYDIIEKAEKDVQYLVRNWITITTDEITRAVDASVRGTLTNSFQSRFLELSKEGNIQIFCNL